MSLKNDEVPWKNIFNINSQSTTEYKVMMASQCIMPKFGLVTLVSCLIVIKSTVTKGVFFQYSKCQQNNDHSLDCSSTGITSLSVHSFNHNTWKTSFWPNSAGRTIKHLDLSNNAIPTFHVRTLYNFLSLETLNLSTNHIYSISFNINHEYKTALEFLPELKTLMLSRNQLTSIPEGLGELKSLETLSGSVNRITCIYQDDFSNCTKLKTIDLMENKIYKIHPDAFRDTRNLKVLSLRSNALITISPVVFMYSHVLKADIDLSNNPWACDCKMHDLKHFLSFLSKDLGKEWNITCSSPPSIAGQHLLTTRDLHPTCERQTDLTSMISMVIPAGREHVLTCDITDNFGHQKLFWWTPHGRVLEGHRDSHHHIGKLKHLVLTQPNNSDEGLYLCVSDITQERIVYQVYIHTNDSMAIRRIPRNIRAESTQGYTQQEFTLAVCLSVIIPFICAFCLGVFLRPYIERLWKLCMSKRIKKQNSKKVYENKGFTEEPSRNCDSINESGNTYPHQNVPRYMCKTEPSYENYITVHKEQQGVLLTDNPLEMSSNPGNANPLVRGDESVNKQSLVSLASSDNGRLQRRGTYNVINEKDPSSDREGVSVIGALHTVEQVAPREIDGLAYETISPQISLKRPESQDNSADRNNIEASNMSIEIVKSPRNNQFFPAHNHISHQESRHEDEADHGAFNKYSDMDEKPSSHRSSTSVQKSHLLTMDIHKQNEENVSASSDTNSTEDGSSFSFSLSNSLCDGSEFLEVHSEDDMGDIQATPDTGRSGTYVKTFHPTSERTGDSPSDISMTAISQPHTPSVSPVHKRPNCFTEQNITADINRALRKYPSNKSDRHYVQDTLHDTARNSLQSSPSPQWPASTMNERTVINQDPILVVPQWSNNVTALKQQNSYNGELSTSDESEHVNSLTGVADPLQYTPQYQTTGARAAGSDPYKDEAIHQWLQTTRQDSFGNEMGLPSVTQMNIGSGKEDFLDLNLQEGKRTNTTVNSPDMSDFYTNREYKTTDFSETNTNAPFSLDMYSSGAVRSLPVSMQMGASDKPPHYSGGYFVKKKRVFDAFSASLNNGQN
ncbi:leucine-rich repeat-containing protein 66 [Pelodytes ibericus]